jgi:hypothetical protein
MAESRKNPSPSPSSGSLVCPSCAKVHGAEERFCSNCGMPLIPTGGEDPGPLTPAQAHARKIDPRYAEGELVRVAYTGNQAESDLVQDILLEEGIPSVIKRTRGFDVPDYLAAGPRDVYVPESGVQRARELVREAPVGESVEPGTAPAIPTRIVLWVLGGGLLAALIAWLAGGGPS